MTRSLLIEQLPRLGSYDYHRRFTCHRICRRLALAPHAIRAALRGAAQIAQEIRLALGLPQTVLPEDPWLLADYLRETVGITWRPVVAGRGFILMAMDGMSEIVLSTELTDPWEAAWVLAHELGHHLCTPQLRSPHWQERLMQDASISEVRALFFAQDRCVELIADAFALSFLAGAPAVEALL